MCSLNGLDSGRAKSFSVNFDDLDEDLDIPEFIREHNASLRFPAKLMLLLEYAERQCAKRGNVVSKACIAWTSDGKAFVISDEDELVNSILPRIFPRTKFSSFTRKLYRWGFRQLSTRAQKKESGRSKIFSHDLFRRDNKQLIVHMQSITAEGTRRGQSSLPSTSVVNVNSQSAGAFISSMSTGQHHDEALRQLALPSNYTSDQGALSANFLVSQMARARASQIEPPIANTPIPNSLQYLPMPQSVVRPHEFLTTDAFLSTFPSQLDLALFRNAALPWEASNLLMPARPLNNVAALYSQLQSGVPSTALANPLLSAYAGRSILPLTGETAQVNQMLESILRRQHPSVNFPGSPEDSNYGTQRQDDSAGMR